MNKILLIEDNEDDFKSFFESYIELGYQVYPSNYENLKQYTNNKNEFLDFIKKSIIYENISLISIDLNLRDFGFNDSANDILKLQTGIDIIKELALNNIYSIRSIPILIISTFSPQDLEEYHCLSKYIIEYIHKDNIKVRTATNNFPLKEYINQKNLNNSISIFIERYKHFNTPQFNSIFDESYTESDISKEKNILIEALKNGNIFPVYQKIVDKKKDIIKYEVLARVNSDDSSFYPYIKVAKFYGLLGDVTKTIIEKSFSKIKDSTTQLSINIEYEDLINKNFDSFNQLLEREISKNNLIKEQISLEILEGIKHKEILNNIKELYKQGYKISIDDFGTENSNFTRLKDFIEQKCISSLKIDGSFVKEICNSEISKDIIESIITLAKKYNIDIVLEYIHDEQTFEFCKKLDDKLFFQGYYLGKPSLEM